MPVVDTKLEAYAEAHTTPVPGYLDALAAETRERFGARAGMLVGTLEGRFLQTIVAMSGARNVLEVGTFTGYSALAMAAGLPPDGTIVTCEISDEHAEVARRHIAASPFADRIDIRLGKAIDTINGLDGPFDFVFIDADKESYLDYYEAVLPKLTSGGLIAADNTLWSGQVLDASDQSSGTVAIRAFNDRVAADPRVVAVQLTIRDGVTLIRRAPGG